MEGLRLEAIQCFSHGYGILSRPEQMKQIGLTIFLLKLALPHWVVAQTIPASRAMTGRKHVDPI